MLLVEDDFAMADTMKYALEPAYRVWHAPDGMTAKAMVQQAQHERAIPDLIVLDLILPDVDGLLLCAALRSIADVPIIICSARGEPVDRVLSLKLGADAFIRKPFDLDEFMATVEAVLRRATRSRPSASSPQLGQLLVGMLTIDIATHSVTVENRPVDLTPIEFRLLLTLAARPGQLVPWQQLGNLIWDYEDQGIRHLIQVHVGRLRTKLQRGSVRGPPILSVRGLGYKLQTTPLN